LFANLEIEAAIASFPSVACSWWDEIAFSEEKSTFSDGRHSFWYGKPGNTMEAELPNYMEIN
jgi:hypothetical protein